MSPRSSNSERLKNNEIKSTADMLSTSTSHTCNFKWKDVRWVNVIVFSYLHIAAIYAIYLLLVGRAKLPAFFFAYANMIFGALGITVGAHRLWAHKCYKANWQMRLLLMLMDSTIFINSIYEWVRDHRVHHKYTDTDADPHNYNRGFFFAHIGWLLVKKHPDVKTKGASIDMGDLEQDPIVMFQKKYYFYIMPLLTFVIPPALSYYFFDETLANSWYVSGVLRYVIALHLIWSINSVAHSDFRASRPFDKAIKPSDRKWMSIFTNGESFHNFHHTFPWDYKAAEFGTYKYNFSVAFIHFFYQIGWAYDLRTVSREVIEKRAVRTGDGSRQFAVNRSDAEHGNLHSEIAMWGWDDPDMIPKYKEGVIIKNKYKILECK